MKPLLVFALFPVTWGICSYFVNSIFSFNILIEIIIGFALAFFASKAMLQ